MNSPSQSRSRSGYHHGDLREALLAAADDLLDEEGLQGLTLRACARRAGVSHAAPKHHFADLSELLSIVAARSFDRLTLRLEQARADAGAEPDQRFIAAAQTYVAYARAHPAHFRLMFRSDSLKTCNETLSSASARTFAELADNITLQRGEPDVTPEDLRQRILDTGLMEDILLGWSYVHGYTQLLLEGQLAVFAQDEDLDGFLERTIAATGRRLSRMLRERTHQGID
ncbi:MAG: TetR-like C-terminal domain-containing protein [Pseudomonadales bacterium]